MAPTIREESGAQPVPTSAARMRRNLNSANEEHRSQNVTKKAAKRLTESLLETAKNMHALGIFDDSEHTKITMRHAGKKPAATAQPLSPDQIRLVRERAHMSQAVFARHLNVTTGHVSQLERGVKRPTGAALILPNVIRRKGIDAIL
jgi:putative transcriptional regulator